jgi:hypothetical protein
MHDAGPPGSKFDTQFKSLRRELELRGSAHCAGYIIAYRIAAICIRNRNG